MLLHACLLLFIITTDKTLALSPQRCGGEASLDQGPVGRLSLTVPGIISDSHGLNSLNQLSLCTWMIRIPPGRTLLLKVAGLEGDSSVSVRCVWNKKAHDQVLESTGTARLSGCDGNKAALTWTGAGTSSDVIQLSYYVQEDERNSSEDHTSPHSDGDLLPWSPTGTSFTSRVSEKAVRGTEGVRGHRYDVLEWSPGPRPVSGPSSQGKGLLHPTSPLQGLSVARTGTLPLPEERPNNGADTSGAAHRSDGPISATHPYFRHTDASNTETNPSNEHVRTPTDATARRSNTLLGTGTYKYTTSLAPKHSGKHKTTQAHTSRSGFNHFPSLTSSFPELRSLTTWESATVPVPRGAAVSGTPGEIRPHSWRSQRSTDGINSDQTSGITSDPLESPTEPPRDDASSAHTYNEPTGSSTSSRAHAETHQSSATHITESDAAVGSVAAGSFQSNTSRGGSFESATSDVSSGAAAFEPSEKLDNAVKLHISSTQSETNSPQSTEGLTHSPHTPSAFTQTLTGTDSTRTNVTDANTVPSFTEAEDDTASQNSAATETTTETFTLRPTDTLPQENSPTDSPVPPLQTSTFPHQSASSYTHTTISGSSHATRTPTSLTSVTTPTAHADDETEPTSSQASTINFTPSHTPLLSSTHIPATHKQPHGSITTAQSTLSSLTTANSDYREVEVQAEDGTMQPFPSSTTTHTPTAGTPWRPPPRTTQYPSQETTTTSALTSAPTWSSSTSPTPKFYIVPDQPATVKGESIELLLQMIVEESRSAAPAGLEEDTTAWIEPYLQKAPGFSRLLGVWSSGHAVQSLVEFKTSGALQWLGETGPTSLLERTGLAQAAREGRWFRSSRITNVTLGGLQGDVCDWLLQCPSGYRCVYQPGIANYNCSSVCRFDHCHNHGICTHHPGQLPVCRCLVGEDFWYMGQRCDVRMTRARLVGACLAVLLIMVTVISVLAFLAVRRYRAILIQAKVDQTRSSYRRFNHFDELSGRFWLRSWAGSADSMDNPAFTRSDELLHLRALDRPCCYHDDTLSLASTCPSHGTRINTIYPHSSQYAWRGSEMSMGEGVLDSGKASDLSICSWPVEPIHWTPLPLLQQLASHRTPTVRVSRPRSYCEGMELVDLGKSWTA
ncbi:mucin-5AC isoform X2 [Hippoglossus stenolepis]|uniref:mucin-5AC isoform X2 n=1 Tax=Hippoglossus stenolepis TaxID=195615 RepID=UPI00159C0525|nr:mucin-5AC isoform X2 [Hippoglossus stenolepis]